RFGAGQEFGDRLVCIGIVVGRVGVVGIVGVRGVREASDDTFAVVAAQGQDRAEFARPLDLTCHPGTSYRLGKFIQISVRGQNRDPIEGGRYIKIVSCVVGFAR